MTGSTGTTTTTTAAPQTNPPVTNPPVTNPPVTNPPVTQPPRTNPPVSPTQRPVNPTYPPITTDGDGGSDGYGMMKQCEMKPKMYQLMPMWDSHFWPLRWHEWYNESIETYMDGRKPARWESWGLADSFNPDQTAWPNLKPKKMYSKPRPKKDIWDMMEDMGKMDGMKDKYGDKDKMGGMGGLGGKKKYTPPAPEVCM